MYLAGEDFYYFTYSIFLTLDLLECKNGRYFKDYRKLPFLIEFISDDNLLYILESSFDREIANDLRDNQTSSIRTRKHLNRLDKEYMFRSYTMGIARRSEILKLLFTLEKSGYVVLEKGDLQSTVNVSLVKENIPHGFFDQTLFAKEYKNAKRLRSLVKRLSFLTLDTMLAKIYEERGVKTWAL